MKIAALTLTAAAATAFAAPSVAEPLQTRQMSARPTIVNAVGYKIFGCQDDLALGMRLETRSGELLAVVDLGEGAPMVLPLVPWDGGEPRITWSDGSRTLVWNEGVSLIFTDPTAHMRPTRLTCGRAAKEG